MSQTIVGRDSTLPLTVIFLDVCDYFPLTENMSPVEAVTLFAPVLTAIVDGIIVAGGTVIRCLGDGVLAVFQASLGSDEDVLLAVSAAYEIRAAVLALGFQLRIGICKGVVYYGQVGSQLYSEVTVVGRAVDLAARLQTYAERDQILLGTELSPALRANYSFRPLEVRLKGAREAWSVFALDLS